jgi:adenine deaminase
MLKAARLVSGLVAALHITYGTESLSLPLPIAGLMTDADRYRSGQALRDDDNEAVRKLGSPLRAPFMTLSFMALLVIPELKMSDRGLFDGNEFTFTKLFERQIDKMLYIYVVYYVFISTIAKSNPLSDPIETGHRKTR